MQVLRTPVLRVIIFCHSLLCRSVISYVLIVYRTRYDASDTTNVLCVVYCTAASDADNLLLVVVLSTLSALTLVIVSAIIFCLCLRRRRRRAAGEVAGLDDRDPARLSSVRRASTPGPELPSRSTGLRWFPGYGPARPWSYLPTSRRQTPSAPDLYGRHDWATDSDDLAQVVSLTTQIRC